MPRDYDGINPHKTSSTENSSLAAKGATWWRSLEELADTEEFQTYLHREFPENASTWLSGSRRDFLRLMGASLALAGLSGCDIKQPPETIVPVVKQGNHLPNGIAEYFTTAMELSGVAIGLTVKSQAGRPIKVEGNQQHPISGGATHVFAQAATLDLYDPDRLRTVLHRGQIIPRDSLSRELKDLRNRLDESKGKGFRVLLRETCSPTLHRLLKAMTKRWPESRWVVCDPVCTGQVRAGMSLAFGSEAAKLHPVYHFDRTKIIFSIDCDFLAARERPLNEMREFSSVRRVAGREQGGEASMVKLYHLGSTPTLTGAKADHRLLLPPRQIEAVLLKIAYELGVFENEPPAIADGITSDAIGSWMITLLKNLTRAKAQKSAVVCVGDHQPPRVHALTRMRSISI